MKRLRAAWRALFNPEPPARVDSAVIEMRAVVRLKANAGRGAYGYADAWKRLSAIRDEESRQREIAWLRGERVR
jgi:hypothetical protein